MVRNFNGPQNGYIEKYRAILPEQVNKSVQIAMPRKSVHVFVSLKLQLSTGFAANLYTVLCGEVA
jgi:hypothetical protein